MTETRVVVLSQNAPRPGKRKRRTPEQAAGIEPKRSALTMTARAAWWVLKPRRISWVLGALTAVVIGYGTPHLLITYRCDQWGNRCTECRYFGVQGMRSQLGPDWDCPVLVMLPLDWGALARTLGIPGFL